MTYLTLISFIDIQTYKIPNILLFLYLITILVFNIFFLSKFLLFNFLSSILIFFLFFLIYKFFGGLGFGDVKLVSLISFSIGFFHSVFAIFIATVFSIITLMFLRKQGVEKIPFAPFLSLGTLFSFFLNRGFLL